jgi:hypothetical protein
MRLNISLDTDTQHQMAALRPKLRAAQHQR